ncbi:hypothetical protein L227DRAFT_582063, partial [Lentinus tigrinus ALCF2SS1-6]
FCTSECVGNREGARQSGNRTSRPSFGTTWHTRTTMPRAAFALPSHFLQSAHK